MCVGVGVGVVYGYWEHIVGGVVVARSFPLFLRVESIVWVVVVVVNVCVFFFLFSILFFRFVSS